MLLIERKRTFVKLTDAIDGSSVYVNPRYVTCIANGETFQHEKCSVVFLEGDDNFCKVTEPPETVVIRCTEW